MQAHPGNSILLEIEKDTPQGTVTEKVHLTYSQAWNAYNEAQKAEVNLFDDLLKDLVKAIPEPEQTKGRPRLSLQETMFCAIQKVYSQLSSRRAYSLFQNATERGQIDHAPDFNAPSKLFKNPEMTPILHKLVTSIGFARCRNRGRFLCRFNWISHNHIQCLQRREAWSEERASMG